MRETKLRPAAILGNGVFTLQNILRYNILIAYILYILISKNTLWTLSSQTSVRGPTTRTCLAGQRRDFRFQSYLVNNFCHT